MNTENIFNNNLSLLQIKNICKAITLLCIIDEKRFKDCYYLRKDNTIGLLGLISEISNVGKWEKQMLFQDESLFKYVIHNEPDIDQISSLSLTVQNMFGFKSKYIKHHASMSSSLILELFMKHLMEALSKDEVKTEIAIKILNFASLCLEKSNFSD